MQCRGKLLKISNNTDNNPLHKTNNSLVVKCIPLKIMPNLKYHPNLYICNSRRNLPLSIHLPIKNTKIHFYKQLRCTLQQVYLLSFKVLLRPLLCCRPSNTMVTIKCKTNNTTNRTRYHLFISQYQAPLNSQEESQSKMLPSSTTHFLVGTSRNGESS